MEWLQIAACAFTLALMGVSLWTFTRARQTLTLAKEILKQADGSLAADVDKEPRDTWPSPEPDAESGVVLAFPGRST